MGATSRYIGPGCFDKSIYILDRGISIRSSISIFQHLKRERVDILSTITKFGKPPRISPEVSLKDIGMDERCNRFIGADLTGLVNRAKYLATFDLLQKYDNNTSCIPSEEKCVTPIDFENAFEGTFPSV
ncbi:hypothetical protein CHUAL_002492 [Chamberlinius hualienensis]